MKSVAHRKFYPVIGITAFCGLFFPFNAVHALNFRSIDGFGNNLANPTWGQAQTSLLRKTSPAYQDGYSTPRSLASDGVTALPNPRDISNKIVRQDGQSMPSSLHFSDWLFQWGQFIDHDLDLNESASGTFSSNIPMNPIDIATGEPDPLYSALGIPFTRNEVVPGTGIPGIPAQHANKLTAYLDGSMVYGSSQSVADTLRTFSGGKLKTQVINGEELLPYKTEANVPTANPLMLPDAILFSAGDTRVNEQIGLTAIHTLMVREHNRIATNLQKRLDQGETDLSNAFLASGLTTEDEFLYQASRKVIGAQIQVITYNEFLPLLLGDGLTPYTGYNSTVNAQISEEFANAAFRFGHTTLSLALIQADNHHRILNQISLADAFFNPQEISENGIDSLLMGLASQKSQEFDPFLVDSVRNFLFSAASGGNDLASVNIARGREVGLGSLNRVRLSLGLIPYTHFAEINADPLIINRLSAIYASVDDIDLWVGGLAEISFQTDALLGETFRVILLDQFMRLRDGDRFFYRNDLPDLTLLEPQIQATTLSQLIARNSNAQGIQNNAFIYTGIPESSFLFSILMLGGLGLAKLIAHRVNSL